MRAGQLRERISIQQFTETPNEIGEPVKTWGTFASVWAAVIPLDGDERFTSGQRIAEQSHEIRIRWRAGINVKMRVLYKNRVFQILAAPNVEERDREIRLACRELVDEVVS